LKIFLVKKALSVNKPSTPKVKGDPDQEKNQNSQKSNSRVEKLFL
jgi:hypothetical protein